MSIINKIKESVIAMFKTEYRGMITKAQYNRIQSQKENTNCQKSIRIHGNNFYYNDSHGFLHSLDEIFGDEIYRFKISDENPVIIDCGSNIGLSILFFKLYYPNSRVTAFEPDPFLFEILTKNIKSFSLTHVNIINKGVWDKEEKLKFYSEKSLAGSFTTDFSGSNDIQLVDTVSLKTYLNQEIDFLKLDIEGAEYEVLNDIKDHLSVVKQMFIEYHSLATDVQKLDIILKIIKEAGFRYYIKDAIKIKNHNPYFTQIRSVFDLQLNIFCTRL